MLRVPSAAGRGTTMEAPALKSKFKVFVVLPAYNEEANIGGLLERIDSALTDAWLNYTPSSSWTTAAGTVRKPS